MENVFASVASTNIDAAINTISIVVSIIGVIIGVIGIITTCMSIKKNKSYSSAEYLAKAEDESGGRIENLYYYDFSGISLVAPIIDTANPVSFPQKPQKLDRDRISKSLRRENSVQIFHVNQKEYRFRVRARNGEILYYSEPYESIDSCKQAIKAFVEQYS